MDLGERGGRGGGVEGGKLWLGCAVWEKNLEKKRIDISH